MRAAVNPRGCSIRSIPRWLFVEQVRGRTPERERPRDYGVSFPDFPGVVTAGNLDDARAMAEEALAFHIEGLVADGQPVPEPS